MLLRRHQILGSLAALAGLCAGQAQAATQVLEGQFLSISYDDAALPAGFHDIHLQESALNWDCSSGACTLAAPLSASVVFGADGGVPVSVTSQALDFSVGVVPHSVDGIVDPLGHAWGPVSLDMGKWTIGVDIASQAPAAGDAQFATAYGQFSYLARLSGILPSWTTGWPTHTSRVKETAVLGLTQTGAVGLGPGSTGQSALIDDGHVYPGDAWSWAFTTQLDGARWAYPSSTDLLCSSLDCMDFKTGTVSVNSYALNFDVVATASAVPESGTGVSMLLGLGVIGCVARRRAASAKA